MTQPHIPALVRSLRQRLGLTQEQLAHEVGVTFSTVNQWENGHRRPQPFLLKRLVEMAASVHLVPSSPLNQSMQLPWPAVTGADLGGPGGSAAPPIQS